MNDLKCIALWQPWASAVALGLKEFETRSYPTRHRGPLGIYATKRQTCGQHAIHDQISRESPPYRQEMPKFFSLPFGQLIAVVDLVDCLDAATQRWGMCPLELSLGDFSPGRYAWRLGNVRLLKEPMAVAGRQGFFFVRQRKPFV